MLNISNNSSKNLKSFKKVLVLVLLSTFSLGFSSMLFAAPICQDYITDEWKNSRYSDHSNGTVTDNITRLMWKKCSQGQSWNSVTTACTGSATDMNWQEALKSAKDINDASGFASYKDWRVPNIKELSSLVSLMCYKPSINESVFPDTPSSSFWSSSPYSGNSNHSWNVDFSNGYVNDSYRLDDKAVRLVRGGE